MENPSQMHKVQAPSWISLCYPIYDEEQNEEGQKACFCVWPFLRKQFLYSLRVEYHTTKPAVVLIPGAGPGRQQSTLEEIITDITK